MKLKIMISTVVLMASMSASAAIQVGPTGTSTPGSCPMAKKEARKNNQSFLKRVFSEPAKSGKPAPAVANRGSSVG